MTTRKFPPAVEQAIAAQYLAGVGTVVLGQAYNSAPQVINAVLKRQKVPLRTRQEGIDEYKKSTLLPKATHGKPPGTCRHPTCRGKVMTGQKDSAIRCVSHKDLCCRCWERKYDPTTGYCPQCWQEMTGNAGKFHADSRHPSPGGPGARDAEILSVLDEFMPTWQRDI